MPVTYVNCDSCHAPGSALDDHDHPCANCHESSTGSPRHASQIHTPADVTTCTPCHNASLTVEHNTAARPTRARAIVCDTCHGSADPAVTAAIAAGNSACSACHASADHAGMHGSEIATTPLPATGLVCGDCHDRRPPGRARQADRLVGCGRLLELPPDAAQHADRSLEQGLLAGRLPRDRHPRPRCTAAPPPRTRRFPRTARCFGTGCHIGTDLSAIHSPATTTVAGDVRTSCLVCHADGTPASKDCTTCHTTPGVTTTPPRTASTRLDDQHELLRRRLSRRVQATRHRARQVRGHRRVVLAVRDLLRPVPQERQSRRASTGRSRLRTSAAPARATAATTRAGRASTP